jgi:hypothetical protein
MTTTSSERLVDGGVFVTAVRIYLRSIASKSPLKLDLNAPRDRHTSKPSREVSLLKVNVERAEWDVLQGIREEHWGRIRQMALQVGGGQLGRPAGRFVSSFWGLILSCSHTPTRPQFHLLAALGS